LLVAGRPPPTTGRPSPVVVPLSVVRGSLLAVGWQLSAVIGCHPSSSSAIVDRPSSLIVTSGSRRKAWLNMGRVWPGLFQALGHLKRKKK